MSERCCQMCGLPPDDGRLGWFQPEGQEGLLVCCTCIIDLVVTDEVKPLWPDDPQPAS